MKFVTFLAGEINADFEELKRFDDIEDARAFLKDKPDGKILEVHIRESFNKEPAPPRMAGHTMTEYRGQVETAMATPLSSGIADDARRFRDSVLGQMLPHNYYPLGTNHAPVPPGARAECDLHPADEVRFQSRISGTVMGYFAGCECSRCVNHGDIHRSHNYNIDPAINPWSTPEEQARRELRPARQRDRGRARQAWNVFAETFDAEEVPL